MLFDDNFNFPGIELFPPKMEDNNLVSKKIGLARGNSYSDEYIPYKNYNPGVLKAINDRDKKLLEILELCFRKIDLNLCLDLEPNNQDLLSKFKQCVEELAKCESEFVKSYGPLELMDSGMGNTFTWVMDPWPWEKEDNNV